VNDLRRVQAFVKNAPWQRTGRGPMVTLFLHDDFIHPDYVPSGVRVDDVLWSHRNPVTGLVPVRFVKVRE
jgi:hypothetical protein